MIINYALVNNLALSVGTFYSTGILNSDKFSLHSIFSGTVVGTVTYEISNDVVVSENLVANWITYDSYSATISAPQQLFNEVTTGSFRWIRIKFVIASGTGNVTTNLNAISRRRV